MEIIVGSSALEYFGYNRLQPKDLDVWVSTQEELEEVKGDTMLVPEHIMEMVLSIDGYALPHAVYTIKCSHLGWDNPMWEKHKQDILWLKSKGFDIIPDLYEALIEFWKTDLGDKSFLSLNKDKKQFFTDNVVYKYDHDYLHELVAHPNRPVYEGCLKDNAEVLIDKAKFDMLPFDKQVRMFREEITVIACERWLLNDYWCGKISWYEAYIASLKKTITNLTKNWACDFIVKP